MRPAKLGYVIPGYHSFRMPDLEENPQKIFIETPHVVIAERIVGRSVSDEEIDSILEKNISNWRKIEAYSREADVVLSGVEDHQSQIRLCIETFTRMHVRSWTA